MKCIECNFFYMDHYEVSPYCHFDGWEGDAPCADIDDYEPEDYPDIIEE